MVSIETTIQNKNGKSVPVRLHVAGLLDGDGHLIGGVEAFVDISCIKDLEREKEQFISMLAHDMKSPVIAIHGFVKRLFNADPEVDRDTRTKYLRIIQKEAEVLESLMTDFLDMSRYQTGKLRLNLRVTDLKGELSELLAVYRPRAEQKGVHLLGHVGTLPNIEADAAGLRRAFANLLENAIKFTGEGGTVTLSGRAIDGGVLISVADQGKGIPADDLPYIFDLYHRGLHSSETGGHGLGLAVVKSIIESHGGYVRVESESCKGSSFTVILPTGVRERF